MFSMVNGFLLISSIFHLSTCGNLSCMNNLIEASGYDYCAFIVHHPLDPVDVNNKSTDYYMEKTGFNYNGTGNFSHYSSHVMTFCDVDLEATVCVCAYDLCNQNNEVLYRMLINYIRNVTKSRPLYSSTHASEPDITIQIMPRHVKSHDFTWKRLMIFLAENSGANCKEDILCSNNTLTFDRYEVEPYSFSDIHRYALMKNKWLQVSDKEFYSLLHDSPDREHEDVPNKEDCFVHTLHTQDACTAGSSLEYNYLEIATTVLVIVVSVVFVSLVIFIGWFMRRSIALSEDPKERIIAKYQHYNTFIYKPNDLRYLEYIAETTRRAALHMASTTNIGSIEPKSD